MRDFADDDEGGPHHPLPDKKYHIDHIVFQLAEGHAWKIREIEETMTYREAVLHFMLGLHRNKAQDLYFEWKKKKGEEDNG